MLSYCKTQSTPLPEGLDNVLIFSLGSDGTDGPTDAAGGIVDGTTAGTNVNDVSVVLIR